MGLYGAKPTLILAEQFTDPNKPPPGVCTEHVQQEFPHVHTAQGQRVEVHVGEWIVEEPTGDGYYPIRDDIFRSKYTPVGE